MPLLGRKVFSPRPPPEDLKSDEEVFVFEHTGEVFRTYDDYISQVMLFGSQAWTCQYTGQTKLTYKEANSLEQQALKRLGEFPSCFIKPLLEIVHHSVLDFDALVNACFKHLLQGGFVVGQTVEFKNDGKLLKGKIVNLHSLSDKSDNKNPNNAGSPSSDKENSSSQGESGSSSTSKSEVQSYDICIGINSEELLLNVPHENIRRVKKLPPKDLLRIFIRANTKHHAKQDCSPWIVKEELVKEHSLTDKFSDFDLTSKKHHSPKTPRQKESKADSKQKKRSSKKDAGETKSKQKKLDPTQKTLTFICNKSTLKASAVKGTPEKKIRKAKNDQVTPVKDVKSSADQQTPSKSGTKSDVTSLNSSRSQTPQKNNCVVSLNTLSHGQILSATSSPAKTKLLQKTPQKIGAASSVGRSPSRSLKPSAGKSPRAKLLQTPPKKLSSSAKKSKKEDAASSRETGKTGGDGKTTVKVGVKRKLSSKKSLEKSADKGKTAKRSQSQEGPEAVQVTGKKAKKVKASKTPDGKDMVDLTSQDGGKKNQTSEKRPQSHQKLKQATIFDMTNQASKESQMKAAKKQKTLSEMFNKALQKNGPQLSRAIYKASKEISSPSVLNLATPAKALVKRRWEEYQEKRRWNLLSPEEKEKIREEKRKKKQEQKAQERLERQRQCLEQNKKYEDTELQDLKPLPSAKPPRVPEQLALTSYGDVVMLVDFMYAFQPLLVPKEKFNITAESLMEALVSGSDGYTVLTQVLLAFLPVLLQDKATKGRDVGLSLREMPLTRQSASELVRLYFKANTLLDRDYKTKIASIVEALLYVEFYTLAAQDKLTVLVALCQDLMSCTAIDNFFEDRLQEAASLRKEERDRAIEAGKKMREERLRKIKERERQKQQAKEKEGGQEAAVNGSTDTKVTEDSKKPQTDKTPEADSKTQIRVSGAVQGVTLRQLQVVLNQKEKELKEKEKLQRLVEQEKKMRHWQRLTDIERCVNSLRRTPLGWDRFHQRYWLFPNTTRGLLVESDWMAKGEDCDDAIESKKDNAHDDKMETSSPGTKDGAMQNDDSFVSACEDASELMDVEDASNAVKSPRLPRTAKEGAGQGEDSFVSACDDVSQLTEVENTSDTVKSLSSSSAADQDSVDNANESSPIADQKGEPVFDTEGNKRKTTSTWRHYDDIKDIQNLMKCLAPRGVRESALLSALNDHMSVISNSVKAKVTTDSLAKKESGDDIMLKTFKEDLLEMVNRLVSGSLGSLDIDKYEIQVEKACTLEDLRTLVLELQPAVLPRFVCGIFDSKSTRGKENWLKAVDQAQTLSRLHLLFGVLESVIAWCKSAENAKCTICNRKGGQENTLLLCDGCNLGFHMRCLRPALSSVPEDSWYCLACKPRDRRGCGYRESYSGSEEEASDEENSTDETESVDGHDDECNTCGEGGTVLVCCDTCPLVFHKACHVPPLKNIPRWDWSCHVCRQPKAKKPPKRKRKGDHLRTAKRRRSSSPEERSDDENAMNKTRKGRRTVESVKDQGRALRAKKRAARAAIEQDESDQSESVSSEASSTVVSTRPTNSKAVKNKNASKGSRRTRKNSPQIDESGSEVSPASTQRNSTRVTKANNSSRATRSRSGIVPAATKSRESKTPKETESKGGVGNRSRRSKEPSGDGNGTTRSRRACRERNDCQENGSESRTTRQGAAKKSVNDKKQKRNDPLSKKNAKQSSTNSSGRRRKQPDMEACDLVLRDLIMNEDSWPFREPVSPKEVPDYINFVSDPMDLSTIKDKLQSLQYPDAASFVADVRLMFHNSDKYNLATSEVGQAGIFLENYFEELLEVNLPDLCKQSSDEDD